MAISTRKKKWIPRAIPLSFISKNNLLCFGNKRRRKEKELRIVSDSAAKTRRCAFLFAETLVSFFSSRRKGACVVALSGELGAGKTTFAQGFARGLGVRRKIISPTFVFARSYPLRDSPFRAFFHIDLYRLKDGVELTHLDFDRILRDERNIVVIEWPPRARGFLPRDTIWVRIEYGVGRNGRIIAVS